MTNVISRLNVLISKHTRPGKGRSRKTLSCDTLILTVIELIMRHEYYFSLEETIVGAAQPGNIRMGENFWP